MTDENTNEDKGLDLEAQLEELKDQLAAKDKDLDRYRNKVGKLITFGVSSSALVWSPIGLIISFAQRKAVWLNMIGFEFALELLSISMSSEYFTSCLQKFTRFPTAMYVLWSLLPT